jgi:hypothetical protein
MKKIFEKIRDIPYAVAAAVAVTAMTAADEAAAQTTIGQAANSLLTQTSSIGKLMLAGSAIGGIVMFATGLFKLKQASENPQTKYSEGAWRILVGAGLVAIPAVAAMMTNSLTLGGVGTLTQNGGQSF